MDEQYGWRGFTHDYRSPFRVYTTPQIWPGIVPFDLPEVDHGWYYCRHLEDLYSIVGFWPKGRPLLPLQVKTLGVPTHDGAESRCRKLSILRYASEGEKRIAWRSLGLKLNYNPAFVSEIEAWNRALDSRRKNPNLVRAGIERALQVRGYTGIEVVEFSSFMDLWRRIPNISPTVHLTYDRVPGQTWEADILYQVCEDYGITSEEYQLLQNNGYNHRSASAIVGLFTYMKVSAHTGNPYKAGKLTHGTRDAYLHGATLIGSIDKCTLGYTLAEDTDEII